MKKILMAVALTSALALTACGNGGTTSEATTAAANSSSSAESSEAAQEGEQAASGEQIVLKYAAAEVPGTPEYEADLKFIEEIEEGSGGRIKVEFYHSSQLGNDKQVVMSAMGGGLDIVKSSAGNLMDYSTALAFTDLPGLFKNQPHVRATFDNQEIRDWVAEKIKSDIGMVPVNYDIDGGEARALFYNSKNGLAKVPEDMKGLKLRTTGSEIEIALFDQWGASSVPMNFNELYLALQQGTVQGQENPIPLIETSNFDEVQKYLSLSGHIYNATVLAFNPDKWNASLVCIKHGENGANVFTSDGRQFHGPVMPARVYKTLGAGDSFCGTFIAKLMNGHPIDEALKYAAAAASITISGKSCSDSMPDLVLLDSYMQAWISGRIESWDGWKSIEKGEQI